MGKSKNQEVDQAVEVVEVDAAAVALEADISASFVASVDAGNTEDQIKMDMIGAGATFKNVTRLYNSLLVDNGMAMAKEERDNIIIDTLTDIDLSDESSFTECVSILVDRITGTTEKSAASLIRAYGKKNDLEVYKKPKSEGAAKSGFANDFYAFLIANPTCSVEEADSFIMGSEEAPTSSNVQKHKSHYLAIHKMVNTIAA